MQGVTAHMVVIDAARWDGHSQLLSNADGRFGSRRACSTLDRGKPHRARGDIVIVLGIVLLVVGYLLGIPILWTLGIILVVVGVILVLLGSVGRPVMGRRHYW